MSGSDDGDVVIMGMIAEAIVLSIVACGYHFRLVRMVSGAVSYVLQPGQAAQQ